MRNLPAGQRIYLTGWMLVFRVLYVGLVWAISSLFGASVLGTVAVLSGLLFLYRAAVIWFGPRPFRVPPTGSGGGLAGDRFPRRPGPFRPAGSLEGPLPHR